MTAKAVAKAEPITPAQMLAMAVEQGADLDKLERLMDLQERWEQNQAKKAFTTALSRFRQDCPDIEKTRKAHNSKYAGLAESLNQIKNAMSDNGLSHNWTTSQDGGGVTVTCTVTHVDGHSISTSLCAGPDTSGSKNSIQAIGSTVSYLERYTLFALLGLASKDQDTDGTDPQVTAAVDKIRNAVDLQTLQEEFSLAWGAFPKNRPALTAAKDMRKKELI